MAFIKPSRERYDPEKELSVAGSFATKCIRIEQGIPDPKWKGKTLIAVEFEIDDDDQEELKGLRCSFVVPESIYVRPEDNEPTIFLTYARMMGVKEAEKGFDPVAHWLNKRFYVVTELYQGKARVRQAIPIPVKTPTAAVPAVSPPAPTTPPKNGKVPF